MRKLTRIVIVRSFIQLLMLGSFCLFSVALHAEPLPTSKVPRFTIADGAICEHRLESALANVERFILLRSPTASYCVPVSKREDLSAAAEMIAYRFGWGSREFRSYGLDFPEGIVDIQLKYDQRGFRLVAPKAESWSRDRPVSLDALGAFGVPAFLECRPGLSPTTVKAGGESCYLRIELEPGLVARIYLVTVAWGSKFGTDWPAALEANDVLWRDLFQKTHEELQKLIIRLGE